MIEKVSVRHETRKKRGTNGQGSGRRRRCRQRTENRAGNEGANDKEIHSKETRLSLIIWINRAYFKRVRSLSSCDVRPKARSLGISPMRRGRSFIATWQPSRSPPGIAKKILSNLVPSSREYRRIRHSRHFYFLRTWSWKPLIKKIAFRSFIKTPWNLRRMRYQRKYSVLNPRKDIISCLLSDILNQITLILERHD